MKKWRKKLIKEKVWKKESREFEERRKLVRRKTYDYKYLSIKANKEAMPKIMILDLQ